MPAPAAGDAALAVADSALRAGEEPQILITSLEPWARPDLVDRHLRIVVEADSFPWHGDRVALRRDARRDDLLVADGWRVLRFAWEDVRHDQAFIGGVLRAVVLIAGRRPPGSTEECCAHCGAA